MSARYIGKWNVKRRGEEYVKKFCWKITLISTYDGEELMTISGKEDTADKAMFRVHNTQDMIGNRYGIISWVKK